MLTQAELKSKLRYCPDTGIFTRIKSSSGIRRTVGGVKSDGYFRLYTCGKSYYSHRLAWFYVYGKFPSNTIDHINGIKTDNRISNLREATRAENIWNIGKTSKNKSGFKGVSFNKSYNKWSAVCTVNNKTNHLGFFITPELASQAYQEFAKKHHGEFARF